MKGIQFIVDDSGERKAVVIDLAEYGELWEDIYDGLIAESRKNDPKVDWDEFERELDEESRRGEVPDPG